MPITLDQMLAAIPRARNPLQGLAGLGDAVAGMRQRKMQAAQEAARLAEEQRQANLRDAQLRAQLTEETRHNQAIEADAVAKRELLARQAAGQQLGQVGEAVRESGGNPDVVRSAAPGLEAYGVHTAEQQTDPSVGGLVQLSQFPGMDFSLGPVPQMATGAFDFSGNATGSIDAPAVRQGQLDAAHDALMRFSQGGIPGITSQAYEDAAAAAGETPYESPADALKAASDLAEGPARNATSMVNAARQAESVGARSGAGLELRADQIAYQRTRDIIRAATANNKLVDIKQRIMDSDRVASLVVAARRQDDTGLMAATALGNMVKATAGTRYSDADMHLFRQAFGDFDNIEQGFNNWLKSGQRTPLQMKAMKRLADIAKEHALGELHNAGTEAWNNVHSDPSLPDYWDQERIDRYADQAYSIVTGEASEPAPPGNPKVNEGGGASVGASKSRGGILAITPEEDADPLRGL